MDPYKILGVNSNATNREVKKAYNSLVIMTHPDKNGDSRMFKKIKMAYDVIKRERRAISDCPTEQQEYVDDYNTQVDVNNCTNETFNSFYQKHARVIHRKGYGEHMKSSGKRESENELYNSKLTKLPDELYAKSITKRYEPKPAEATFIDSCERLGSVDNDKTLGSGYDYLKAHVLQRNDITPRNDYTSLGELIIERKNISHEMSKSTSNKKRLQDKEMLKLNILRLKRIRRNDEKNEEMQQRMYNNLSM